MAFSRGTATKGTRKFIPIVFSSKMRAIFDETCVAMDCVNRDWEGEIANAGDIVTIRYGGNVAWSNYTVDGSITYSTVSENSLDLVIDQQKYAAFKLDDIDNHQSDQDWNVYYGERMAISGKELVDDYILTGMIAAAPAGNTIGATGVGGPVKLTKSNVHSFFTKLMTALRVSKIFSATNQTPFAIVPEEIYGLITESDQMTHATAKGDEVIRSGVVGQFAGFHIKPTTQLTLNTGGAEDYFDVIAGVTLAYSFAFQVNKTEKVRLENTFGDGMRGLMVYGSKDVNPSGLARLVCKL